MVDFGFWSRFFDKKKKTMDSSWHDIANLIGETVRGV